MKSKMFQIKIPNELYYILIYLLKSMCSNKQCIRFDKFCDYEFNCFDRTDEKCSKRKRFNSMKFI